MDKTEKKKWLSTIEAARMITPKCTDSSARNLISNLVKSGFIERYTPQLAIVHEGDLQMIENRISFYCIDEVKEYMEIKRANINKYKAGGVKIKAEKEGQEALEFDSMLDAHLFLECSYNDLRYAVLKGTEINGYKITKL
jgi:hypothetical protein